MKKKFFAGVIAMALVILCAGAAFAQSIPCSVPALNLTIDIPDSYLVFTDETMADPEMEQTVYDLFGVDIEDVRYSLESQDIYLDALELDGGNEFVISMTTDGDDFDTPFHSASLNQMYIDDFLTVEQGYIDGQIEYFQSAEFAEEVGGNVLDVKEVRAEDAVYIAYHIVAELDGDEYDQLHYLTVKNGQNLDFSLRENGGNITPEHEKLMADIMGSVRIDTVDNAVSKKMEAAAQANMAALVVGIVLAVIVAVCAYLKYKKRRREEQAQSDRMAAVERDSVLRANAAEQAKYVIGRLSVLRDEGVITPEEYERKVADVRKRAE